MPFLMVRNDIVNMETDAIVNPANSRLLEGRGTSRGIFLTAGEEQLSQACARIGGCDVGKAVITPGFALRARYIIHAVCPRWQDGMHGEQALLSSAYTESLKLADQYGLESIAFPLLSSGNYGYPKEAAMRTAVDAITAFLADHEMTVYLVLYDQSAVEVRREIADQLDEFLAEHYVEMIDEDYAAKKDESFCREDMNAPAHFWDTMMDADLSEESGPPAFGNAAPSAPDSAGPAAPPWVPRPSSASPGPERREAPGQKSLSSQRPVRARRKLSDLMSKKPETFSEMLLRLIDERGLKDSDVYKKANVDRRHFAKIRKDPDYTPKKATVFAFAVALELSYDETKDLLMRAGYAFSVCSRFDMILQFFIENHMYNVFDINEALFSYDLPTLGE